MFPSVCVCVCFLPAYPPADPITRQLGVKSIGRTKLIICMCVRMVVRTGKTPAPFVCRHVFVCLDLYTRGSSDYDVLNLRCFEVS